MTRVLTKKEIENLLDFIVPQDGIPLDTAMSVVEANKERFRAQLVGQKVYPSIIPKLKEQMKKSFEDSLVQAGESVGVICAQSIGEKQTQTTLNSVDWTERILYTKDGNTNIKPIGEMIDKLLAENPLEITHIEENRTEYLPLPDGYLIPSTDENGMVSWYRIEAITRHLPVGKLVKVITQSGRSVMATQSKSFLVWNGNKFDGVLGSDVKVGDILPTTSRLVKPVICQDYFDMKTIFPMSEYIYTTEVNKVIRYQKVNGGISSKRNNKFNELNGVEYVVPYNRYDTMLGKRKNYFENCKDGLIYIHKANEFVSHIPDKIPLDNDFGFFIGLYLAEGWVTKTFLGVSNNDEVIRKRITDFCDRYGITYHLVVSKGKNVRNGISSDLKVHSVLFARLFKAICDTGSANKCVPDFAYTAPEDFIKGLIDGYISGDGTISNHDGSIIVSSVSENLITGISFLLSYFGIFGRISSCQQTKNNVGSKNIKKSHILRISNGYAQDFAKIITLTESNKNKKLHTITLVKEYKYKHGIFQTEFPERDVYFDKVVYVEYVDGTTQYVYDLTIESTRNFQLYNGLNQKDTFHTTGSNAKIVTQGVPRFQELINATKKPRIVNHKIYFNDNNKSIEEVRENVGHSIVGLSFKDISNSIKHVMNKEDDPWYEGFKILYNKNHVYKHCISISLNMEKLFEFKITMEEIASKIEEEFDDLYCIFSPPQIGQLDIFVDTENIELPQDRILFIDHDNADEIYLEECVQVAIESLYLFGIQGILEIFFVQEGDEWICETNGSNSRSISTQFINFKQLLALPNINFEKTISNNVWDIYDVLGIEAARQFLIEEFMSIMEGINPCHTYLLVDRMTHCGNISSITRYTMKKDESGPFGRASFEETMDNFLNAAGQGEIEPTEGISASIICGKRGAMGTGMINLAVDFDRLPSIEE